MLPEGTGGFRGVPVLELFDGFGVAGLLDGGGSILGLSGKFLKFRIAVALSASVAAERELFVARVKVDIIPGMQSEFEYTVKECTRDGY